MAARWQVWVFDPLWRFQARRWGYTWLAVFFVRLAIWYHLEDRKHRRLLDELGKAVEGRARRWMARNAAS